MKLEQNHFKQRLADTDGSAAWGMFLALADPVVAEICAGAGFDLIVIDDEHGANDARTVLAQLQALSAYPLEPAIRVVSGDAAVIKRSLDLGARTLFVPMVETAAQARSVVDATRYRGGSRGVSSARAARWGRVADYHANADDDICVVVQLESSTALDNVEAICEVDGVDGAFVGPMDLATSLGHPGGGTLDEVVTIVEHTISRIAATGTAAGVMATTPQLVERYLSAGARFLTAGVDTALLAAATTDLRRSLPEQPTR